MNPLKVTATGSPITSANISGLQIMTNTEVKNYIANVITEKFASSTDGTGTAELNITTDNSGSGISIGVFTDTVRTESIGTHPATGSVNTTTYYAKQVTGAAAENITNRPLSWNPNLTEMSDSDIDGVMDLVIESMATESTYTAGQYRLQPSAPVGGTWVARYTITDQAQGGNTETYLWQKTTASTIPDQGLTPLKSNGPNSVKQMTELEIEQMLPNFRNRIIETGIANYKLQSSAPSGGTWVQMGAEFEDTRQQISPENYTGTYTGNFTGNYTGNFQGTINYSGTYTEIGNFSSQFTGNYTGLGNFTGFYSSPGTPTNYTGFYSSIVPGSPTPTNFTGFYSNPGSPISYTGFYSSIVPGSPTPATFTGFYSGPGSPISYTGFYTGPSGDFFNTSFTGPPQTFLGFYSPPFDPLNPVVGPFTGFYTSPVFYTGTFQGPPVSYAGFYSGPATPISYTGFYTGIIPGSPTPATFTGFYSGPGSPTNYTGFYTGIVPGSPTPATFTGFYSGPGSPTNYTGFYTGPKTYSGTYTGFFSGGGASYTGFYSGEETFSGTYSGSYINTFTGNYSGATVQVSKDIVSTVKLWIRTA
jgi:hypothetical protein